MTRARIHCVKPDTGAGMATVIFFLFSNAYYFDSVICQKKLSMPRVTCLHSFYGKMFSFRQNLLVTAIQMCLKFSFTPGHYYVMTL